MIRLLVRDSDGRLGLCKYENDNVPPYAVLSHTWSKNSHEDEVTLQDIECNTGLNKGGYGKLEFIEQRAAAHNLRHFWIDTCCINQSSSAELTEAIGSMFRWYQNATRCYVFLSDVSVTSDDEGNLPCDMDWKPSFQQSRWFTRGWTLQELVAPKSVEFFSKEGTQLGNKESLKDLIYEATGISPSVLTGGSVHSCGIPERLKWTARRKTSRAEDIAYCLLGIFDVHIMADYSEGEDRARIRLWEEIMKTNRSKLNQVHG